MRIALVGGSGFIGSWVLRELGAKHEFVVIDAKPVPDALCGSNVTWVAADLLAANLAPALKGVDGLVHLAALRVGADHAAEAFGRYLPSVEIAANVFEACCAANVSNVVHVSSVAAYGARNARPWTEDQVPHPETCYGVMKVAVETLGDFYSRCRGLRVKSLRVAQVVGVGERGGFMLATFFDRAKRGEGLNVFGTGQGRREYVYVRDVASAIGAALARVELDGVFNVGTGSNTSHLELAETVNEVFGNKGNIVLLPDKPDDRAEYLLAVGKAKAELGWQARWTLRQALEDMRDAVASG